MGRRPVDFILLPILVWINSALVSSDSAEKKNQRFLHFFGFRHHILYATRGFSGVKLSSPSSSYLCFPFSYFSSLLCIFRRVGLSSPFISPHLRRMQWRLLLPLLLTLRLCFLTRAADKLALSFFFWWGGVTTPASRLAIVPPTPRLMAFARETC